MPYNGGGIFDRVYSWVTDAANGLPISSSRMDQDTNDIADGLTNCITRDGQSPAEANIPLGGFKITGLAAGVAGTDAANVGQLSAAGGNPWILETAAVAFVNTFTFTVVAVDATARYSPGTRIKMVVTTGTGYATVAASSYSAPDTTVLIVADGIVLDSGLSAISYSLLTPTNTAVPVWSDFFVGGTGSVSLVSATQTILPFGTSVNDRLSEISGNSFVPRVTGLYIVSGVVLIAGNSAGGINLNLVTATVFNGASALAGEGSVNWPYANASVNVLTLPFCSGFLATAGDIITVKGFATFTSGAPVASLRGLNVRRVW